MPPTATSHQKPTTRVRPATASAVERRRLSELFEELCRIESPSGRERACAERVIAELHGLGLEVHEDGAGVEVGSECGNLLARIPARADAAPTARADAARILARADAAPISAQADAVRISARTDAAPLSVLLCAHLDTVPPQATIEPVLLDGGWENANEGILGADNKAAVAVLLVLARRLLAEGAPVDIELLFTVCEERSLAGAHALDPAHLHSRVGYVFDHASPIGEVVVASPCHFRLDVEFRGTAAHAGVRPEEGSSAILAAARAVADMPLGRIDAQTTANVGRIEGGSAINVVPERCQLVAEVRSLREEAAEATVAEIVDCVHEAANLPDCDCDVDISVRRTFSGYTLPASTPVVQAAELALRGCGYSPTRISSGGASDANALIAKGLTVVNLANGTERPHEPAERVSTAALEGMLEVALALPGAVAAQSEPLTR
jgi:tripeptide aminopeptidase